MSAFDEAARELADLARRVEELETQLRALRAGDTSPRRTAYRTREVAEMTGLKLSTIQSWIREGRLEAEDMGGWYAVRADVAEALVPRRAS